MNNNFIAPFITRKEYQCPHCGQLPPGFKLDGLLNPFKVLFSYWETLRRIWTKPIKLHSGYRCIKYNAYIGGAKLSVHLFGCALDSEFVSEVDLLEFTKLVGNKTPELRMGRYRKAPRLLHIDVAYLINPKAHLAWEKGKRFESA